MDNLALTLITKVSTYSDEELRAINAAVCDELKHRRHRRDALASCKLREGQRVKFDGGRNHGMVYGIITRINPKTIIVKQEGGWGLEWKVSPGLLKDAPRPAPITPPAMVAIKP